MDSSHSDSLLSPPLTPSRIDNFEILESTPCASNVDIDANGVGGRKRVRETPEITELFAGRKFKTLKLSCLSPVPPRTVYPPPASPASSSHHISASKHDEFKTGFVYRCATLHLPTHDGQVVANVGDVCQVLDVAVLNPDVKVRNLFTSAVGWLPDLCLVLHSGIPHQLLPSVDEWWLRLHWQGACCRVVCDVKSANSDEMSAYQHELVTVVDHVGVDGWAQCQNAAGQLGMLPLALLVRL